MMPCPPRIDRRIEELATLSAWRVRFIRRGASRGARMDDFLRRQAARRILYDAEGLLRGRLTPNELLALWCPYDGTDAAKRRRVNLASELRRAIASKALEVDREAQTVTKAAPAGGWAVPFGADFRSDLEELHARTAPRTSTTTIEWVTRQALRSWLLALKAWPPEHDSPLREWWPNETLPNEPKVVPRQPSGKALLEEVYALEKDGLSVLAAMKAVAAKHGVTLSKIRSERYPKRDDSLPKAATVGNSRKRQLPRQH